MKPILEQNSEFVANELSTLSLINKSHNINNTTILTDLNLPVNLYKVHNSPTPKLESNKHKNYEINL